MRILYSHYLSEESHPATQMVGFIAKEMASLGHEVRVHRSAGVAGTSGEKGDSGLPRKPSFFKRNLWFAKALSRNLAMQRRDRQAILEFRPDVILARQDAYCMSMVWAAQTAGVPLVTYADAPVAYENRMFPAAGRWHPPLAVEAVERWVLRRSRAIITVSRPAARQLERYRPGVPVHVVPNGVVPECFVPTTLQERSELRRNFGLSAPHIVGFIGSFRPFHGLDRLREMILATAHRADTQWLLVGDGPGRQSLEAALTGRAHARFLGRQPAAILPKLLSLMDVTVAPQAPIPGDFYFCPLKVLEYGAAGRAVVTSGQGDIRVLLPEGCAVVLESDETTDWVNAIDGLLEDPVRREAMGLAARSHVLAELTWRRTAERVIRVLVAVVEGMAPKNSRDANRNALAFVAQDSPRCQP